MDLRAEPATVERSGREPKDNLPLRSLAALGLVVGLLALAGIGARATYGARTTADEPQYLLTALSLAANGDLDISDQLADEAYLDFHELPVDPQTRALDASGRRVSPHNPLLPVLLAGPVAASGWIGAKVALAALTGLTAALTAWLAVGRFDIDRRAAFVAVAGCFAGIPLAAYGTQVYPEMPAALLVLVAVGALTGPTDRVRSVGLALAAIVALPWLAVKYVPIAAVLGAALLIRVRDRRRLLIGVLAVTAVAAAAYLWAHQVIYGGWTAYASGDHFAATGEFSVVGTEADLIGRSRRLVGLLVDRRFGIAVWSPMWFLLPPAIATAVTADCRRGGPDPGRPRWILPLAIVGAGWLTATFVALTMHGWWVPGRQVVVVLPVVALFVARWASGGRWRLVVTGLLAVVGASNWLWLAIESSTGRRTLVVDFAETAAPLYRLSSPLFPDGASGGPANDLGLGIWTLIVLGVTVLVGHRARVRTPAKPADG